MAKNKKHKYDDLASFLISSKTTQPDSGKDPNLPINFTQKIERPKNMEEFCQELKESLATKEPTSKYCFNL